MPEPNPNLDAPLSLETSTDARRMIRGVRDLAVALSDVPLASDDVALALDAGSMTSDEIPFTRDGRSVAPDQVALGLDDWSAAPDGRRISLVARALPEKPMMPDNSPGCPKIPGAPDWPVPDQYLRNYVDESIPPEILLDGRRLVTLKLGFTDQAGNGKVALPHERAE